MGKEVENFVKDFSKDVLTELKAFTPVKTGRMKKSWYIKNIVNKKDGFDVYINNYATNTKNKNDDFAYARIVDPYRAVSLNAIKRVSAKYKDKTIFGDIINPL